jgi:hypothetical protein
MDLLRIIIAILLPPLGVFLQVVLGYPTINTKPSELRFLILLSDGTREVGFERMVADEGVQRR